VIASFVAGALAGLVLEGCRARDGAGSEPGIRSDPSTKTSTSTPSPGSSLAFPETTLDTNAPANDAMQVVVSKTWLMVDGEQVLALPPVADAVRDGFGAKNKPSATSFGPVAPLVTAVKRHRAEHPGASDEVLVLADGETPYRLLTEVLYTLGFERYLKFHLLRLTMPSAPHPKLAPPLPPVPMHAGSKLLALAVRLGPDGVAFIAGGAALGGGCTPGAAGVTVPNVAGTIDLAGVRRCAQQLASSAAEEHDVRIDAEAATRYDDVLAVMDALRSDGTVDLFTRASLRVPR
jgi:biopolymer transport protein ExbD